jgi:hypothetical protein
MVPEHDKTKQTRSVWDLKLERLIRLHCGDWDDLNWARRRRSEIQLHFIGPTEEQSQWIWNNKTECNVKFAWIAASSTYDEMKERLQEYTEDYKKCTLEELRKDAKYSNWADEQLIEDMFENLPSTEKCIQSFLKDKEFIEDSIRDIKENTPTAVIPMSTFLKPYLSQDVETMVEFCEYGRCETCRYNGGNRGSR